MKTPYKVYRKWMDRIKERVYKKLMNYYNVKDVYCFYCGTPLEDKRFCSRTKIITGKFTCIDHKLEISSGKKPNTLHGTNLFKYLDKIPDGSDELSQYQFLCNSCNLKKAEYYKDYLHLNEIGKKKESALALQIYENMAHFKNYPISKMKR